MREGSQSARIGKAIRITRRTRSVRIKGITPLKIVAKLTSFTTLLMTNTFMPTGGGVIPKFTAIEVIKPEQYRMESELMLIRKMNIHDIRSISNMSHQHSMIR